MAIAFLIIDVDGMTEEENIYNLTLEQVKAMIADGHPDTKKFTPSEVEKNRLTGFIGFDNAAYEQRLLPIGEPIIIHGVAFLNFGSAKNWPPEDASLLEKVARLIPTVNGTGPDDPKFNPIVSIMATGNFSVSERNRLFIGSEEVSNFQHTTEEIEGVLRHEYQHLTNGDVSFFNQVINYMPLGNTDMLIADYTDEPDKVLDYLSQPERAQESLNILQGRVAFAQPLIDAASDYCTHMFGEIDPHHLTPLTLAGNPTLFQAIKEKLQHPPESVLKQSIERRYFPMALHSGLDYPIMWDSNPATVDLEAREKIKGLLDIEREAIQNIIALDHLFSAISQTQETLCDRAAVRHASQPLGIASYISHLSEGIKMDEREGTHPWHSTRFQDSANVTADRIARDFMLSGAMSDDAFAEACNLAGHMAEAADLEVKAIHPLAEPAQSTQHRDAIERAREQSTDKSRGR